VEPTGKIPPQSWMALPETQQVMAALLNAGEQARFIGGCVRDSILKRDVQDVDIATPAPPERVIDILQVADIHVIPTGLAHGTVTAVLGQHRYEITTLRIDHDTDGRRARVAYTNDWTQDAARRDFTINAMSCDLDGNIYDPYDGIKDLSTGYIRFVGHAHKRIEEDLLRLLRFYRFLAIYGRYPVNGDALTACRDLAPRLGELSGERVRGELFRILMAPNPATTLSKMIGEKVLPHILPEAGDVGRLRAVAWLKESGIKVEGIEVDPVRRLAALLKPNLSPAEVNAVAERLKFSTRERKHLLAITAAHPAIDVDINAHDLRLACYNAGTGVVVDRILLAWGGAVALEARLPKEQTQAWLQCVEAALSWPGAVFPLRGRDIIALGIPHGPEVGALLSQVQDWWLENDFHPDHEGCLRTLKQLIKSKTHP